MDPGASLGGHLFPAPRLPLLGLFRDEIAPPQDARGTDTKRAESRQTSLQFVFFYHVLNGISLETQTQPPSTCFQINVPFLKRE